MRRPFLLRIIALTLLFLSRLPAAEPVADPTDAIWIEGEAPSRSDVTRHPWWYDKVKADVLSGGAWLSHYSDQKPGTAEYDFSVVTADAYALWVRANPAAGAQLSWQLDAGASTPIDFKEVRGPQNIAQDNKPDMRFIAWVKAGSVKLAPGKHTVRFTFGGTPQNQHHGGLDCFVFTRIPFVPAGTKQPAAMSATGAPDEWFPLVADEDPFDPASVIDMSRLIPAPAGQLGFVHAVGKGLKFEQAAAPVKFWGCGANLEQGHYTREQLARRARYLRKFGVNIVRQHPLTDEVLTAGATDARKMDEYDWWFAELKKNGIYTDWSVFYHFTVGPQDGYDPALWAELPGQERKDTYGLITVSPELWAIRNQTLAALLVHQNPYTGLRYADDPALAVVEMENEDSVFFWNPLGALAEGRKTPLHSKKLRERWAAWVKVKYKTDDALKVAWGQLRDGDSTSASELLLMSPWELPGNGPRGRFTGETRRAGDYVQFLAELQASLYQSGEQTMRAAGFKAVSVTTAWQVGGASTEAANIWTDTVGGMIDRHNYFGGGENNDAGLREGKVSNASHLAQPGSGIFTVGMKQVESKPFSVTEWTQCPPNQWKVEAAPLFAFYGMGLQGWDASYHFAQSGTRLGDGWPRMSAYATDTPAYLGQFPALAFAIHRGHIAESAPVAARRLVAADLFSGTDALRQDATKGEYNAKTLVVEGGTPLETFAIGRITVDFQGGKSEQANLGKFWDQQKKVIASATGELTWDYGRQLVTVHAAKTQAIIGRPGSEPIALPGVTATIKTPFVSLLFTPLDDAPLAQSKHILITALAQDKQTGARYSADGTRLEAAGTAPLLLEPVQASLRFAGGKPASVAPCDPYGVPMAGKSVPIGADGTFAIDGTWRAYYYEVKR